MFSASHAAKPPKLQGYVEVKVWNTITKQEHTLFHFEGSEKVGWYGRVPTIAFSGDGKLLAVPGGEGLMKIWSLSSGEELVLGHQREHAVHNQNLVFAPDGRKLIVADRRAVKECSLVNGSCIELISYRSGSVVFSPDGSLCVISEQSHALQYIAPVVYDILSGKKKCVLPSADEHPIAFNKASSILATVSLNKNKQSEVRLWDIDTGKVMKMLEGSDPVAFSPDGCMLAMKSNNQKNILLYNLSTGERSSLLHRYSNLTALAFSSMGAILASGGTVHHGISRGGFLTSEGSHSIKVWNLNTRTQQDEFSPQRIPVQVLAFSPDAKLLASAGSEVRLDPTDEEWINGHSVDGPRKDAVLFIPVVLAVILLLFFLAIVWRNRRAFRYLYFPRFPNSLH